jgi:hypothetical protein
LHRLLQQFLIVHVFRLRRFAIGLSAYVDCQSNLHNTVFVLSTRKLSHGGHGAFVLLALLPVFFAASTALSQSTVAYFISVCGIGLPGR